MDENTKAFLLTEYVALRNEIELSLKDSRELERNAVFAIGVTLVWLAKESSDKHLTGAYGRVWWIPFAIAAIAAARSAAILRSFHILSEYILIVEAKFSSDPSIGWERFSEKKKSFISMTGIILWLFLLVATVIIAICHP